MKPGLMAVVLFLVLVGAIGFWWQSNGTKKIVWQEVKSNYSPIVAVFDQMVAGAKAALEIDPNTGEVGFGSNNYQGEKLQLFTKMVGGNFSKPRQEDNKVKWLGVLSGVDVEVHTFDGKIKEFIHINNREAAHSFTFELEQKGEIELRDEAGMYITAINKKTGEELFTLDYPIAIDANNKKIPYHYRLENPNDQSKIQLILEVHDPKLLENVSYPLILDPPMTVREYDEILVKIGQNGDGPGNAKDGDITDVKPMSWPWGDLEYRDYVIVRVPKMTQEERLKFDERFVSISDQKRAQAVKDNEPPAQSQTKHLDGAYQYGLDYVSLIANERVRIYERDKDGLEQEIGKDGLVEIIRNRAKDNPIIDATALNLNEIIKQKEFVLMYDKIKKGESQLALGELPGDESVLPSATRLAKRLEEKKSWLAKVWDKIVQPARAATNTYTIGTTGRNYSTIQAWEDARDAGTDIEKGECYNDSAFTAGVIIDGTTGDADSYMWLTVASGNRHSGTAATGVKIDMGGTGTVITTGDDYTIVEWLEITDFGSSYGHSEGVLINAGNNIIRNNIIHDEVSDNRGLAIYVRASANTIYNNIIYGGDVSGSFNYGGIYFTYCYGSVYNNTIYEITGGGIVVEGGYTLGVKNNIVSNANDDYLAASGGSFGTDSTSDYNIASDTTAPGSHSIQNATDYANYYTSVTNDAENLHVKDVSAVQYNAGVDLSSVFTTDVDGQTRPTGAGTWDIGADEIVVAGSAPTVSLATDTPDPTNPGRSVSFIIDWNDADSGETVKIKICKTNSLTNQNCDGGFWASSTAFTTNDPVSVIYNVASGDAGQTRDYWAFVCDSSGVCTEGIAGSFTVNAQSTVPNIKVRGGLKVR